MQTALPLIRPLELDERLLAPGLLTRIEARVFGAELDRALAAGANPAESPALARRAAVLARTETRVGIAEGIERALESLERTRLMRVRPLRGALLAAEPELRDVQRLLRSDAALYTRGVAMLATLLGDSSGPLFNASAQPTFLAALRAAREALDGS